MMLGQKMQYMWIYVFVKFSKHEFQWRMVFANDVSYGIIVLLFQNKL